MKWCERCGRYFTPTGRIVNRSVAARGPVVDIEDGICPDCWTYGDTVRRQMENDAREQ